MPLPVQVFNLQVGVGGCARRAAVRPGSGSVGGARGGRGGARGAVLGARAPPASQAALGSGPRPAPASRANAFPCGRWRPGSGQDAGQPGAQLRVVVGVRPEPQPCAQQVGLAARDVGRLQPERQPLGLHAALRGTRRPACGRRPSASPEAPASLPHRGRPAVALLTSAERVSVWFICSLVGGFINQSENCDPQQCGRAEGGAWPPMPEGAQDSCALGRPCSPRCCVSGSFFCFAGGCGTYAD